MLSLPNWMGFMLSREEKKPLHFIQVFACAYMDSYNAKYNVQHENVTADDELV